jgi:Zn-dependent membrane protease YugP
LPEGKLVSGYFFFVVFFAGFFFAGMAFLRIGLDFVARFVAFRLTGIGPPLGWDAAGKAPFLMGRSHFSRRSPAIIETCYLKRKRFGAKFRKKF